MMVVVAVVGILSGIIYGSMTSINERAVFAKAQLFSQKLNSSLAENIVGQWDLNGDAKDLSGNGNDGAIAGTVTWDTNQINCVSGGCATFAVGRIQIPNLTSIPGDMTFSGWFKKTTSTWAAIAFLGKRSSSTGWMLYRNSGDTTGYFRWYSHYVNTSDVVSTYYTWPGIYGLEVGKWYHFSVSRTAEGATTIYVNGKITSSYAPPADFKRWSVNTYGVSIGSERSGSSSWSCTEAQIDEVTVYDAALLTAQIQENYYFGLNNLFINNQIGESEYLSRMKTALNE